MKREYDFSQSVRGKFYRANAKIQLPIYLDKDVEKFVTKRAQEKKVEAAALVNELLRKGISIVEAVE